MWHGRQQWHCQRHVQCDGHVRMRRGVRGGQLRSGMRQSLFQPWTLRKEHGQQQQDLLPLLLRITVDGGGVRQDRPLQRGREQHGDCGDRDLHCWSVLHPIDAGVLAATGTVPVPRHHQRGTRSAGSIGSHGDQFECCGTGAGQNIVMMKVGIMCNNDSDGWSSLKNEQKEMKGIKKLNFTECIFFYARSTISIQFKKTHISYTSLVTLV
jgi:hypothetical protein